MFLVFVFFYTSQHRQTRLFRFHRELLLSFVRYSITSSSPWACSFVSAFYQHALSTFSMFTFPRHCRHRTLLLCPCSVFPGALVNIFLKVSFQLPGSYSYRSTCEPMTHTHTLKPTLLVSYIFLFCYPFLLYRRKNSI